MTLQNVRSLLWRGEDLGFGGGNTRELITPLQIVASARPVMITQGFAGSLAITNLVPATAYVGINGVLRFIMNRNPRYWMTLNAYVGAAAISIPIAPLDTLYLPQHIIGPATLTMNSTWPVPIFLSGQGTATVPLASAQNTLTFDWMAEG